LADAVTRGRMAGAGRERQLRRRVEFSGSGGSPPGRPEGGDPGRTGSRAMVHFGGQAASAGTAEASGSRSRTFPFEGRRGGGGAGQRKRSGRRTDGSFGDRTAGRRAGEAARRRLQPGASRAGTHPPRRAGRIHSKAAEPATPRRARSRGRATEGRMQGKPGAQPQGREWLKQVTGSEEAEAVKVVRNGEGGPKRVWEPATRRSWKVPARAGTGRPSREVDSSGWERRRGTQSHGRMLVEDGRRSRAGRTKRAGLQERSSRAGERP
jgi:hypothetical protein